MSKKTYLYGPVPSRRLGYSLGVDLFQKKKCSFDCLYCQLGPKNRRYIRRSSWIDMSELKKELANIIKTEEKIDFITISGSGEPTLHKGLGKIISTIKRTTCFKYPVCLITNSSLLYRKDVRKELIQADLIIPSLDAVTEKIFRKVNRPHKDISIKKIIDGLMLLRKEFKGKIWLEIMLVKGVNDSLAQAKKFKSTIIKLKPDKVQLNLPIRPPAEKIGLPDRIRIKKFKKIIAEPAEVVIEFKRKKRISRTERKLEKIILDFLLVRPATIFDLSKTLNINLNILSKELQKLRDQKKIKETKRRGKIYFLSDDKRKC